LRKIDRLVDGGIELHTQAVIVPGFNDGEIWERTVKDLWERKAYQVSGKGNVKGGILSLSCIPVGLTGHRQKLPFIQEIDSDYAAKWVNGWKKQTREYAKACNGEPWLLLADEWFTRAGLRLPGRNFYSQDWTQIENGVGLVRRFQEHSRRFIKSERAKCFSGLRLLLLTGSSFAPYLSQTIESLKQHADSKIKVVPVPNIAFGASVTIAGLLCGHDLLSAAQKNKFFEDGSTADAVVVPSASVRVITDSTGRRELSGVHSIGICQFLDDMTVSEMQSKLELPVILSGDNLFQLLSNIRKGRP
jgi:NifB/MoaA-like Fe-S oxidoreductase